MTELSVPPDADSDEARTLVEEFIDVGDVVEVYTETKTGTDRNVISGTVTNSHRQDGGPDYLELDEQALGAGSVAYEDISNVVRQEDN